MPRQITEFRGRYAFLSNFAWCDMYGRRTTVEHCFQAYKTESLTERNGILRASSPLEARRMGKTVTLRPGWEDIKVLIMQHHLAEKFKDPYLEAKLLATGDLELIEGNHWGDRFWGVVDGEGRNELGKLLMALRQELRNAA
ncbi:NADAR family protein [Nocardia salmonicida]|uniref:NADAR family protein n=1 Tax=Nocardia salmonicida TaxID=53431 RepID=UPI0033F3FC5A